MSGKILMYLKCNNCKIKNGKRNRIQFLSAFIHKTPSSYLFANIPDTKEGREM